MGVILVVDVGRLRHVKEIAIDVVFHDEAGGIKPGEGQQGPLS